ncbi:hypothetical protein CCAN11_1250006 [Capnocytophaga canimorsus]|uniref:Uncharacterized protein n=1 Tax=Capnocytophaga canimorsus TaxID=28188 RepID=A0A0B7IAM1_9FLAO|nr:hypothetical protein CCAN11_1250006 [Capnocytophaga canimorsus]
MNGLILGSGNGVFSVKAKAMPNAKAMGEDTQGDNENTASIKKRNFRRVLFFINEYFFIGYISPFSRIL